MQKNNPFRLRWLATLLLALVVSACDSKPNYSVLPAGSTVLAFGDSVTHGTGAARGEDYPSLLAIESGWNIVNAGIPGDTAHEAVSRLAPLLEQHRPELVIIELGGNDFLRKKNASSVKENLRNIIQQSQAAGSQVVLVAVPHLSILRAGIGALSDSDIYGELADETGVVLVPDVFAEVLSDDALRADAVHPNARGYQQFTAGIINVLRSEGLLQSVIAQ